MDGRWGRRRGLPVAPRGGGAATATTAVRVLGFLVSLAAFVLVRALTRGLPWWLSVALAIGAMLVAGRLAGVVALDVLSRVQRHQARGRW